MSSLLEVFGSSSREGAPVEVPSGRVGWNFFDLKLLAKLLEDLHENLMIGMLSLFINL